VALWDRIGIEMGLPAFKKRCMVRVEALNYVWEQVALPDTKVLLPGIVTHSTDLVEHPELVAERIRRFERIVGPERVITSADCGFGGRTPPPIAWAKIASFSEGARAVNV
jgi:methionine synthase II (cobalamin-independent)